MKRAFAFFLTVIATLTMFACTPTEKSAVAYMIVHKSYVGVVNLVVEDDIITDAVIDEYYLPYTWAKVAGTTVEGPSDVVVVTKTSSATPPVITYAWYAKYIVIGDKQFTGELRTTPLEVGGVSYTNETVKYVAEGIDDLFVWLLNSEANCEWYVAQLEAHKAFVANVSFAVNTTLSVWNQGNGFQKDMTGYWPASATVLLGWQGNMDAIYAAVEGKAFDPDAVLVRATTTPKVWSIGDAVSGATLSDMQNYYDLIGLAYAKTQAE